MMTASELAMHSTVRIECTDASGRPSSGTGFFYNFFPFEGKAVPAVVTNKHVITGSTTGCFHLTLKDSNNSPIYGSHIKISLDNFEKRWIHHPDKNVDLAIMLVANTLNDATKSGKIPYYVSVSQDIIWGDDKLHELSAIEEISMVGYPNGLWDEKNNIPVIRRGITATPAYIDYNGKKEFVIDAACFPGSSGSPVFIINEGSYSQKRVASLVAGSRIIFLGVLYAGPQISTEGEIIVVDVPTDRRAIPVSRLMMNLGYCIKAGRIVEFEAHLVSMGLTPPDGYTTPPLA